MGGLGGSRREKERRGRRGSKGEDDASVSMSHVFADTAKREKAKTVTTKFAEDAEQTGGYATFRRRSSQPSSRSAKMARSAAGIAPAKITALLTMATPRKRNVPRP